MSSKIQMYRTMRAKEETLFRKNLTKKVNWALGFQGLATITEADKAVLWGL